MSGSSGGPFRPRNHQTPCDEVEFEAVLASPRARVIATLKVSGRYPLALHTEGSTTSIVVLNGMKEVAGAIVQNVANLVRCIDEGNKYVAEVRSIEGATVRVLVTFVP